MLQKPGRVEASVAHTGLPALPSSLASGGFGQRLARFVAADLERRSVALNEDEHFLKAASIVGRFKFESSIHAREDKPFKAEGAISTGVDHIFKTGLTMQLVFHRRTHHRQVCQSNDRFPDRE